MTGLFIPIEEAGKRMGLMGLSREWVKFHVSTKLGITAKELFNIPAKFLSTHSESSSLGGEEFGIVESSRR
jgi:hypothetical protein